VSSTALEITNGGSIVLHHKVFMIFSVKGSIGVFEKVLEILYWLLWFIDDQCWQQNNLIRASLKEQFALFCFLI